MTSEGAGGGRMSEPYSGALPLAKIERLERLVFFDLSSDDILRCSAKPDVSVKSAFDEELSNFCLKAS